MQGIWIAAGPGVIHDPQPHEYSILDLMPALLQCIGAPLADDMPGRPSNSIRLTRETAPAGIASYATRALDTKRFRRTERDPDRHFARGAAPLPGLCRGGDCLFMRSRRTFRRITESWPDCGAGGLRGCFRSATNRPVASPSGVCLSRSNRNHDRRGPQHIDSQGESTILPAVCGHRSCLVEGLRRCRDALAVCESNTR